MGIGLMDWWDGAFTNFASVSDIAPDLTGKTIVVTGANSGIGLVSTKEFARKNAKVIMLCRSESKAFPVLEQIRKETGNENLTFVLCDLSDWGSIIKAASTIKSQVECVDVLLNNAGILGVPKFTECKQGVELHMSSNHFGHYILTRELLPLIINSKEGRIVNVTSNVHEQAKVSTGYFTSKQAFNFDVLKREWYFPYSNYCQSKLANILFTFQLQKFLIDHGIEHVYVNAVHPGVIQTNILSAAGMNWLNPLIACIRSDVETGAMNQIYVATHPHIIARKLKGKYFTPVARLRKASIATEDPVILLKFWTWTEEVLAEKKFQSEWKFV